MGSAQEVGMETGRVHEGSSDSLAQDRDDRPCGGCLLPPTPSPLAKCFNWSPTATATRCLTQVRT